MKKIAITLLLSFISLYQIQAQTWSLAGNNLDIYNSNFSSNRWVGVGTSSPTSTLTVSGSIPSLLNLARIPQATSVIEADNNSTSYFIGWIRFTTPYVANSLIVKRNFYQNPIPFPLATITDFVVTSAGYVGIGTATPVNPLHVVGNANVTGNVGIGTTSPSAKLDVRGTALVSGNVGIGTATPAYPLDVVGNAKVSGVTSTSGLALSNYSNYVGWANQIKFTNSSGLIRHLIFDDNSGSSSATNGDLVIIPGYYGNANNTLRIDGVVQIGNARPVTSTYTPFALSVNGNIIAKEVQVETSDWADFVLDKGYKLPALSDIEAYISLNKHLPDVPSECDAIEKGVNLGEMNKVLLQKVEELTLYLIQQQKEIDNLKHNAQN